MPSKMGCINFATLCEKIKPKTLPRRPKTSQEAPRDALKPPKTPPGRPKTQPRHLPRRSRNAFKIAIFRPKRPDSLQYRFLKISDRFFVIFWWMWDRFLVDVWWIFWRFLMDFGLIFDRCLIDFLIFFYVLGQARWRARRSAALWIYIYIYIWKYMNIYEKTMNNL